jgi:hypothetical protein
MRNGQALLGARHNGTSSAMDIYASPLRTELFRTASPAIDRFGAGTADWAEDRGITVEIWEDALLALCLRRAILELQTFAPA